MADELVSFCIRKGMTKFCKFFMAKKFGTIENFMLDHNMDQFIFDENLDPVEKAAFVEKINEYVATRLDSKSTCGNTTNYQTPTISRHVIAYTSAPNNGRSDFTLTHPLPSASTPRKRSSRGRADKDYTRHETYKLNFNDYSTNPEERYIYEINRSKQFDCIIDGIFYISKYRLPDEWSTDSIVRFLVDGGDVNNCKDFCEMFKAVSGDMFPLLGDMFIYEIPRHALSGICGIFSQKYGHLDDRYLYLKQNDPETDVKYVKAYKQFIDISDILKEKLKNKFRNRSYRLKAQNMWPYQKMNVSAANKGKKRTLGMKKAKGSHSQSATSAVETLVFLQADEEGQNDQEHNYQTEYIQMTLQ